MTRESEEKRWRQVFVGAKKKRGQGRNSERVREASEYFGEGKARIECLKKSGRGEKRESQGEKEGGKEKRGGEEMTSAGKKESERESKQERKRSEKDS